MCCTFAAVVGPRSGRGMRCDKGWGSKVGGRVFECFGVSLHASDYIIVSVIKPLTKVVEKVYAV